MVAVGLIRSPVVLLAGAAVLAALIYAGRNPAAVGESIGAAAVDMATGALTGGTIAIGEALGIPQTDVSKGAAELAAGDYWNASFDLPAGDFIVGVWRRLTD